MCWQRDESRMETPLDWAIVMEERNVIASIVRAIKQVRVGLKLSCKGNGIWGKGVWRVRNVQSAHKGTRH